MTSEAHLPNLLRCLIWLCGSLLCLTVLNQAAAGELPLKAQLVWGTNEEKPKGTRCKELDAKISKKLGRVFKWKNYFEIEEQKVVIAPKETKKLKMSPKCELECKFIDEATLEIKLFGEGKWTKTIRQSVKALQQGELAVIAGDDKDSYDAAWFVVLSAPPP